ncbi:MAG: DivIVA domain-containing protein [Oscillospiraceae bacterium]|jgi:DivIVA domain|nr:DivIVA domain-containing protein [Oscillospiraceae bacterium]
MITAQDIREKTFEKSRMNGYDMASVDDFLEELAEDIGASQKENAVLKSKMKVLVDKIEEYRANEEALNMAILSAQKLAVQIESEARQRAAAMIEDAERQVKAKVGSIQEQTAAEERRLADAQTAAKIFLDKAKELCNEHLTRLGVIGGELELPEEEPEVAEIEEEEEVPAVTDDVDIDEAVRSIEEQVSRPSAPEPALDLDLSDFDLAPAPKRKNLSSTQSFNL